MRKVEIISPDANPRLKYVINLIFNRLIGIESTITSPSERQPGPADTLRIWYDIVPPPGTHYIPRSRFLTAPFDNQPETPPIVEGEIPGLFPDPDPSPYQLLPFDLFSAVFYLATDYPQTVIPSLDAHDRLIETESRLGKAGFYDQPMIHLWVEQLREKLGLPRPIRSFDYEITVDVDNPWKFQHKPAGVQFGGLARAGLRFRLGEFKERFNSLFTEEDPFDTYDEFVAAAKDKLRFFFLVGGDTRFDSRFSLKQPPLRDLISRLAQTPGVKTGVHPSYDSSENEDVMKAEVQAMQQLTPVHASRQHFLRLRLPHTYRQLLSLGITHDYSTCCIRNTGFRTGLCIPYPWFDLERNEETALMLHPAAAMDRTLQQYENRSPAEALSELMRRVQQVREVQGMFIIILHNETLSESGEWKGWKQPILQLIAHLQS